MTADMQIEIYTDGAARGNPGPAGAGVVIKCGSTSHEFHKYLGAATNNQAEYQALIFALQEARKIIKNSQLDVGKVICYSDSELLVKQLRREYKVKNPELGQLFARVWNLAAKLPAIEYRHIPRERNKLADKLANQAIDHKK